MYIMFIKREETHYVPVGNIFISLSTCWNVYRISDEYLLLLIRPEASLSRLKLAICLMRRASGIDMITCVGSACIFQTDVSFCTAVGNRWGHSPGHW